MLTSAKWLAKYGLSGLILRFWSKFADASPEDRKKPAKENIYAVMKIA
jgi:hypothetical protein